ncbi:hypothetical protein [Methylobacterium sp. Leaf100]|uniref:hypothetical protein n=1 Tax=Methylobacterium sp. Leaf100 TaxID=1736252 RepID=UPI0012E1F830|nr:hypothetical protein [Methylobacterium sp. Leaf100]
MPATPEPQSAPLVTDAGIPAEPAGRPILDVRFIMRVSRPLHSAILARARRDGVTAGAWVRHRLLADLGLRSLLDEQSGRPMRRPPEDVVAISSAIRELAAVNAALAMGDGVSARAALDQARAILIPMVVHMPRR